ncbi:MAG TPA: hypothetical protein VMB50_23655 [Myxococcales bacterium]|nr:hypothetical protein [Myxococcales bacterium]
MKRAGLALAALVAAAPAAASIARALSLDDLAARAEVVVLGRVTAQAPRWTPDHRRIVTRVTVRVEELWKGSAGATITVLRPGGELDGLGQVVLGEARFAVGELVVLFLVKRGDFYRVVGMSQGAFRVEGGTATQDLRELALVRASPDGPRIGAHGEGALPPMALGDLEARVAAAAH